MNDYLPGQGIARHRDYAPYGRAVASLSLLSPCVMDFREVATGGKERFLLEPRSLLVLSDAARYDWEHGIAPRKRDVWHGVRVPRGRRLSKEPAPYRRRHGLLRSPCRPAAQPRSHSP